MKKIGLIIASLLILFSVFNTVGCTEKPKTSLPVVLLTDFGSADYRVPQLKGIMYSSFPEMRLIDASNDVPAFDIPTGAFILDVAAREFPRDTVFVGIISPYSQTEMRYLVVTTNKNQIFVLPDNGLITYVARNTSLKSVFNITNQKLFDQPINELAAERIEGKIGALIASGYRLQDVGPELPGPRMLDIQEPVIANNRLLGTVTYVDNFGNCVTNISAKAVSDFGLRPGAGIQVSVGQINISAKYGMIYSDVAVGKEVAFVNNNLGFLQLSMNMGSFSKTHNVKAGAKIEIGK